MIAAAAVAAALTIAASGQSNSTDTTRQTQVERNSERVMPFSMNATMHRFVPTRTGGVQTVTVHDGDVKEILLVRSHLRKEARAFAHGDFADPASIHGRTMPGLQAMHAGAKHIIVRYADVQNGASIIYDSGDRQLVAAIHAWFRAQASDHRGHATMKM